MAFTNKSHVLLINAHKFISKGCKLPVFLPSTTTTTTTPTNNKLLATAGSSSSLPICCTNSISTTTAKYKNVIDFPFKSQTPLSTHQLYNNHCHKNTLSSAAYDGDFTGASGDPVTLQSGVLASINDQIEKSSHGRLFAVIHVAGKQFKVTSEDLLLILANKQFADVGERIILNKVLLAAGKDFTMVGRPLLHNVRVEATVVEKTLSHPKIWFRYKKRKNWQRTRLIQEFRTILRINSIEIETEVD